VTDDPYDLPEAFAPLLPLDHPPPGGYVLPEVREAALRHALRGVELGEYDERFLTGWAARLDDTTVRTLVSWTERARLAELVGA
jgi:hypothetical protein